MGTVPATTPSRHGNKLSTDISVRSRRMQTRAMARQPRGAIEAGRYHVCTRSAGKVKHFRDDLDRTDFCNRIAKAVKKFRWRCEMFCLMTTHYHLMLDVPEDGLQRAMHWLNGTYAQQFNRRHGRWGHLCGARYTATPIESKLQLIRTAAYVALNPVRAGICENAEDYVWSSYRGTAGFDRQFDFVDDRELLAFFGGERKSASRRFRRYVEARRDEVMRLS